MRLLLLACLLAPLHGQHNTLTPEERQAGWTLLFDGRSLAGWHDPARKSVPGDAWIVEDGCLKTRLKPRIGEDLLTEEAFGDFELQFDWRIAPGGNSGVKYRIQRVLFVDESKIVPGPDGFEGTLGREMARPKSDRRSVAPGATAYEYTIGYEFQLLDDARHPDAKKDARHTTGALYSFVAPTAQAAKPAGEWNQGQLVVRGDRVEHWINGTLVMQGSLSSDAVREGAAKRWRPAPEIQRLLTQPRPEGPLSLQHHGDEAWFRNLKLRRL